MRKKYYKYRVFIGDDTATVIASSVGNAFRVAVRRFIRWGFMLSQPKSTPDGGWENTSVILVQE